MADRTPDERPAPAAEPPVPAFGAVAGVAWAGLVLAAYLVINHGYFAEKIGTFGRFLLGGG